MTRVYWDSMLLANWFQENPGFHPRIAVLLDRMMERGDRHCGSLWSLCELMALPCQRHDPDGMARLHAFFHSPAIELLPLGPQAAVRFAEIRAASRIPSADALHLAIAAAAGVNVFLTNNLRLHRLKISGIDFITGLDINLY